MMASVLRAAVVQFSSNTDKARNLAIAKQLIEDAATQGANLVVLPELFNALGSFPEILDRAEPIDGHTARTMSGLASHHGIHLCAGSICEATDDPSRGLNTSLFFGPDGSLLANYRKIHLFDVHIPNRVEIAESSAMQAGDQVVTCHLGETTIGFATCYDLRFPELFRQLSSRDVQIVCFPSAFTKTTGQAHWRTLVRARAIENQCYMLASNQVGKHNDKLESYGHSMIVGPWGDVLAELTTETTGVAIAEIDLEFLVKMRNNLPALKHRKKFL